MNRYNIIVELEVDYRYVGIFKFLENFKNLYSLSITLEHHENDTEIFEVEMDRDWFTSELRDYIPENVREFSLSTKGNFRRVLCNQDIDFKFKENLELLNLSHVYSDSSELSQNIWIYPNLKYLILDGSFPLCDFPNLRSVSIKNCLNNHLAFARSLSNVTFLEFSRTENLAWSKLQLGELENLKWLVFNPIEYRADMELVNISVKNNILKCAPHLNTLEFPIESAEGEIFSSFGKLIF